MSLYVREKTAIVPKDLDDGHVGIGQPFYELVSWDGGPGDMEHHTVLDRYATRAAAEERIAWAERKI